MRGLANVSFVAASSRVLQTTVRPQRADRERREDRAQNAANRYCHPEAMGGRVRGELGIAALPMTLRCDSRGQPQGEEPRLTHPATAERCHLGSPMRQRWEDRPEEDEPRSGDIPAERSMRRCLRSAAHILITNRPQR
jgi:hypothetical protein